jgi:adenosylmethionine-8-amino-7-oxononanoate aminotransferase
MERLEQVLGDRSETICALVMEPRVQGAAGMWMHPPGYLRGASKLCRKHGIWLLLDEVLTGMGRTGEFLACQKEGVRPDFIALAKGLSGGYLPLAATIVSGEIFEAFLGEYSEFKTFFHGHSYTGNALGCAAALASLDLLAGRHSPTTLRRKAEWLRADTARFWEHPNVGDVRQEGMICAIELVEDRESRKPLSASRRIGYQVCRAAARHGLLTRPIGDVLVLMPPYCVSRREVRAMAGALWRALTDILPRGAEHDGD